MYKCSTAHSCDLAGLTSWRESIRSPSDFGRCGGRGAPALRPAWYACSHRSKTNVYGVHVTFTTHIQQDSRLERAEKNEHLLFLLGCDGDISGYGQPWAR